VIAALGPDGTLLIVLYKSFMYFKRKHTKDKLRSWII
jgi:hypothetical protein